MGKQNVALVQFVCDFISDSTPNSSSRIFYMHLLFLQAMVVPCLASSTSLSIALLSLVVEKVLCVIALRPNHYAQWCPLSRKLSLFECLSLERAII
jgi:hypothetical protein